jgi:hypothetical protein
MQRKHEDFRDVIMTILRLMREHVDAESKTALYHQIMCYRMDTVPSTVTVGCNGKLAEGGSRLDNFVRCV